MIRLHVLGPIRLSTDGDEQLHRILAGDRRLALLIYLALGWPALRRRDSILPLLWSEEHTPNARHSLRQLLHVLRGELGEGVIVTVGDEYVGVSAAHLWCDAVVFARSLSEQGEEPALALYGGRFCEGFFVPSAPAYERWLEDTREQLHERAVAAARRLASRLEAAGRLSDAVHWGKFALRLEPGNEELLRWLMPVCERSGGVAAALRAYEDFAHTLVVEFDLSPSRETQALVAELRARHQASADLDSPVG